MPLLFLLVPSALVGLGVITLQWSQGGPAVAVDRQRAREVKQVEGQIAQVASQWKAAAGQSREPPGPAAPSTQSGASAAASPAASSALPTAPPAVVPPGAYVSSPLSLPPRAARDGAPTVRIASFNIQVFGVSKLNKPPVVQLLAEVIRRFDVVAIQEIRSADDAVMPRFVSLVNASGARYDFVIGPRLGRTSSKEQYAFVYDTARIEVDPRFVYTVPDPQDRLHREPLVAYFRVRGPPPSQAFTFALANIHTDPDETASELDALADVFVGIQRNGTGEDDVILLGDLNVNEYRLGNLGRLPGIRYAVSGAPTNTRRDKTYDNIVFDGRATVEYTGRWGVLDLMREFGLSRDQALEVSDHMPVWAEFTIYEGLPGQPVAVRAGELSR